MQTHVGTYSDKLLDAARPTATAAPPRRRCGSACGWPRPPAPAASSAWTAGSGSRPWPTACAAARLRARFKADPVVEDNLRYVLEDHL